MNRFVGSLYVGAAAFLAAYAFGVPIWLDVGMGDATDIGGTLAVGVWLLTWPDKAKPFSKEGE